MKTATNSKDERGATALPRRNKMAARKSGPRVMEVDSLVKEALNNPVLTSLARMETQIGKVAEDSSKIANTVTSLEYRLFGLAGGESPEGRFPRVERKADELERKFNDDLKRVTEAADLKHKELDERVDRLEKAYQRVVGIGLVAGVVWPIVVQWVLHALGLGR